MHSATSRQTLLRYILFAVFAISTFGAKAQVQQTFTPRFSEAVNGDFIMIANNMVSQHPTLDYNGASDNHFITSTYVDIDSDASTFNSSSANLVNPAPSSACLTIKRAFLYWAAANKEYGVDGSGNLTGTGGMEVNWPSNEVKLMLPGSNTYTTLTADELIYDGRPPQFVNAPYAAVKDITAWVQPLTNPYGTYQVANVKATEGDLYSYNGSNTGTSGGWQIVFIYESPQLKRRNITLFDGYANITQSSNSFDILFDGFQTVPNGPVNANMLIGSFEGDRGILGDQLQILDTNGNWTPLTTTQRDANNFFNSKITVNGNPFLDRNPASANTLGYDAALFELRNNGNNLIDNDQTSATVRMTSNQETYGLYLLGLSVEVFEPSLGALSFTTNVVGSTFDPGDTAPVEIRVKNVGNDNIRNLEIALTLPPQVEFVDTDPLPPGVTHVFDSASRELRFFVEDGYTDVNDPEYELDFNLFINHECVTCSAAIALQAMATFTGETNPAMVGTLSSGTVDACGVGNHDPTYLYVVPVLSLEDALGDEGNVVSFGIASSHLLAADATLNLTYANQTTSDADYMRPLQFTVAAGTGTTQLDIPTLEDLLIEPTETFELRISSSDPITILDPTAVGSIIDNDGGAGTGIDFDNTDVIVDEDAGTATFTVRLTGNVPGGFTLDYTSTDGSAVSPDDFTAFFGQLTFAGNDNESYDIIIPIIDDSTVETLEAYTVNLSNLSTTVIAINTPTANGGIRDNDGRVIISNEYTEEYMLFCGDEIPEVPELTFSGGCGAYQVDFTEVEEASETSNDFMIIRTWEVTDSCGNTGRFEQVIFVMQLEEIFLTVDICVTDTPIDLATYLPENFDTNGTFTVTSGVVSLDGSLFDPSNLEPGAYGVSYTSSAGRCAYSAQYTITVNADCSDCNEKDLTISSAVTPNGDGFNDVFEISGGEACFFTYDVMLFNRWGKKVYEARDYQNDWGGTAPNGSFGTNGNLPTGTYYYIINISNRLDLKPINGYIYLGTK